MSTCPHRINEITALLEPCRLLADVGCDHAYVCIQAIRQNKAEKAIACDINKEPLLRASRNIREAGLNDRISVCLSDGLISVNEAPDACTICGMGGLLIRDIMKAAPDKISALQQLILGPHSEVEELRKYIVEETDREIFREKVISDQGKYYVLMDIRKKICTGMTSWTPEEYLTGKPGLQADIFMYKKYLQLLIEKTKNTVLRIDPVSEIAKIRRRELENKLRVLRSAYETV